MKINFKLSNNDKIELGLDYFPDAIDELQKHLYFWIETEKETVKIEVSKQDLIKLIDVITFLNNTVKGKG